MPAFVLIAALVLVPLVVGICLAYAGFKAYTKRRFLIHDIENARVRSTQSGHPHQQQQIELQDLLNAGLRDPQRPQQIHSTFQRSGIAGTVVPANIAPVARALHVESIGGEGVVSFPRLGRFTEGKADVHEHGSLSGDNVAQMVPHTSMSIPYEDAAPRVQYTPYSPPIQEGTPQPDVVSPKPRRMVSNASTQQTEPYDAKDTKPADIWQRIERQTLPLPSPHVRKVQEVDEIEEHDAHFVIASDEGEWSDEDVKEDEPVVKKSAGRSLMRSSAAPLVIVDERRGSVGSVVSTEQGVIDTEYNDFVNPSRAPGAGSRMGVDEGARERILTFADVGFGDEDVKSDEDSVESVGAMVRIEEEHDEVEENDDEGGESHQTDIQQQESSSDEASTSSASEDEDNHSDTWQDSDNDGEQDVKMPDQNTTTESEPQPQFQSQPSTLPQPQPSPSSPPTPSHPPAPSPSPPLLTRAKTFTSRHAKPSLPKPPLQNIKRSNTHTGAQPVLLSNYKPASVQSVRSSWATRGAVQDTVVLEVEGVGDGESLGLGRDGEGNGDVGIGSGTEPLQRKSWASSISGEGAGTRGSVGSQTSKRSSAEEPARNLWGHAVA